MTLPRLTGEIQTALKKSDLILLVTDVFDPEGSMPVAWARLFTLPVLIVVNKADLLPERTPWAEMATWFQDLWTRRFPERELLGVKSGFGATPRTRRVGKVSRAEKGANREKSDGYGGG